MNKYINKGKLFSEQGCLSLEQIMDYLHERLPMKERNHVERHMLDCELCSDAVEGYALMEEKERAAFTIRDLNKSIRSGAEKIQYRWMVAAVTAVMIFGGGLLYLNYNLTSEKELSLSDKQEVKDTAVNKPEETNQNIKDQQDKIAIDSRKENKKMELERDGVIIPSTNSDAYLNQEVPKAEEPVYGMPTETTNTELNGVSSVPEDRDKSFKEEEYAPVLSEDKRKMLSKDEVVTDKVIENKKNVMPQNNVIVQEKSDRSTTLKKSKKKAATPHYHVETSRAYKTDDVKPSGKVGDMEMDDLKEESEGKNILNDAITKYQQKQYDAAIKDFEEILKTEPDNSQALYYNGLSYLELKNYDKAIANFEKVKPGDSLYEDAQWKKTIALTGKGDKENAKKLLQDIINSNGKYKVQAEEELKKLQ
ncbi:MAG: tetratricopeptide repeat protein [Cytophagaceae bacterium]|nr:tetratricopeptide repeat protein [Cytophagaceae bacterium]